MSGADEPLSVFSTSFITRGPGSMSFTSLVFRSVPSLLHSSSPKSGWLAENSSVPLKLKRLLGSEPVAPG